MKLCWGLLEKAMDEGPRDLRSKAPGIGWHPLAPHFVEYCTGRPRIECTCAFYISNIQGGPKK